MKKLISVCISISLLISLAAPLQAKKQTRKKNPTKQSQTKQQSKKQPKQTAAPAGSCPFSQISDSTIQTMLHYSGNAAWRNADKIKQMNQFLGSHPEYRSKCSAELKEGWRTANDYCSQLIDLNQVGYDKTKEFCDAKVALKDDMVAAGLWDRGSVTVYDRKGDEWVVARGANGGTGKSSKGSVNGASTDGTGSDQGGGTGTEGKGNGEQTSLLALDLTKEEFEKLCQAKAENLPANLKEIADKLKLAIARGEDVGPFIEMLAKDSSLDPSAVNYVPFELIQMAFLMYAYSLKPNEASKIMGYINHEKEYIRYVTAAAVGEVSQYSIGANGGNVANESPVGHLQLNSSQRASAAKELKQSIAGYTQDCVAKRLDILRLHRLDQRETSNSGVTTINYASCPTNDGTLAAVMLLVTTTGEVVAVEAGGAATIEAFPATLAIGFFVATGIALNEAFKPGYRRQYTTGLLQAIPYTAEDTSVVEVSQGEVCEELSRHFDGTVTAPAVSVPGTPAVDPAMSTTDPLALPIATTMAKVEVGSIAQVREDSQERVTCMYKGRACRTKNNDLTNRIRVKDLDAWINWSDPETTAAAKILYKAICGSMPPDVPADATGNTLNSLQLFSGSKCGVNRNKTVAQVAKLKGVHPSFEESFKYRDCFYSSADQSRTPLYTRIIYKGGVWTAEAEIQLQFKDAKMLPQILATNIMERLLAGAGTVAGGSNAWWRFGGHEQGYSRGGLGHIHYIELKSLQEGNKMYVCNHSFFFLLNGGTPTQVLRRLFSL